MKNLIFVITLAAIIGFVVAKANTEKTKRDYCAGFDLNIIQTSGKTTYRLTFTTDGYIATDCFSESSYLTYSKSVSEIAFNSDVTISEIERDTFSNWMGLKSVTFNNANVNTIGNNVFRNCTSLNSITIPSSVENIWYGVLTGCTSLTNIKVASGNEYYKSVDGVLLSKDGAELIAYPSGKTGAYTVPNGVELIGNYAFSQCTGLTSLTIPESVSYVRCNFIDCANLKSVEYMGKSDPMTIPNCNMYFENSPVQCVIVPSDYTGNTFCTLEAKTGSCYPSGKCGDNIEWVLDDDGVMTVSGNGRMGYYCDISDSLRNYVQSLNIEYGITNIFGFEEFRMLKSVNIPNSVTEISNSAFSGCSSLTSVNIPNSVTKIGDSAFEYCSSLTSVNIPNSVTEISNYAFDGCSSLTSVNIPNSVTGIWSHVFSGCSSLTSVNIPNSVTKISNSAFEDCSSLISVNIPNSVTEIGDSAFSGCSSLTSVNIPNSVTEIGDSAFSGCSSLTSVNIPNSVTAINGAAFSGCSSLTSVNIPDSVTKIFDYAFYECSSLTSVNIPDSVTAINGAAFTGCSSLKTVHYYGLNDPCNYAAFDECGMLDKVDVNCEYASTLFCEKEIHKNCAQSSSSNTPQPTSSNTPQPTSQSTSQSTGQISVSFSAMMKPTIAIVIALSIIIAM